MEASRCRLRDPHLFEEFKSYFWDNYETKWPCPPFPMWSLIDTYIGNLCVLTAYSQVDNLSLLAISS